MSWAQNMRRWRWNGAVILSLLMMVGVAVAITGSILWMHQFDRITQEIPSTGPAILKHQAFRLNLGVFEYINTDVTRRKLILGRPVAPYPWTYRHSSASAQRTIKPPRTLLGFYHFKNASERYLRLPLWMPIIAFSILPVCWLIHWRRNRLPPLHCKKCGYDLLGTMAAGRTVCPECGKDWKVRHTAGAVEPLETIIAELGSDDWLEAALAVRKLYPHGDAAVTALPEVFELTSHDIAALATTSRLFIKQFGKHAVPFLREQAIDRCPQRREIAVMLLATCNNRWISSTRLDKQELDMRFGAFPEWGTDPEEILSLFRTALHDECLSVRFSAACALEEFGKYLPQTVPVFVDTLQNGTENQQNWAALHLGRIGPLASEAADALERATKSECQYTSLAASNALNSIRKTDDRR